MLAAVCVAVQLACWARISPRANSQPDRGCVRPVVTSGWVRVIRDPAELPACAFTVEATGALQPLNAPACQRFAFVLTLPAKHPGAVFGKQPLPPVAELIAEGAQGSRMPTSCLVVQDRMTINHPADGTPLGPRGLASTT